MSKINRKELEKNIDAAEKCLLTLKCSSDVNNRVSLKLNKIIDVLRGRLSYDDFCRYMGVVTIPANERKEK